MFVNKSPLVAELFPLIDKQGRNVATVVAKATYTFRAGQLQLAMPPRPLYLEDQFERIDKGEIMRLASDLTDHKPATDVLVIRPPGDLRQYAARGRRLKVQVGGFEVSGTVSDKWAFGPVARNEAPRKQYAGTFDTAWQENRMPLLPDDFDYRFNQVASPRQTISPYLRGDEALQISGLGDGEQLEARLPGRLVLIAANASGRYLTEPAVLDTFILHLQPLILELVWRLTIPTRRSIEEVRYLFVYYPTRRSYEQVYGR